MGFTVDKILEDISRHGYTPDELKEVVISFLEPYFENKSIVTKDAMQSYFLEMFSYLAIYSPDESFSQGLFDVLEVYRNACAINREQVKSIILATANLMGQKENLMWTVKSNTPKEISDDIHEATYAYMKHVGDVLEISTKHEIIELYAILETALGKSVDYETIRKRDFGVIVQCILDKKYFETILKIPPNDIKLSDWRNIAYHHTYEILNEKIRCNYGKKGNSFEIPFDKLCEYVARVIKSCNIIDIARRIFIFDNTHMFSDMDENLLSVHDRDVMKIGQLRTAFLGQGFKLVDIKIDSEYEEATIVDLETGVSIADNEKIKRCIHCSQFLYNIWRDFPANRISIIYCEDNEVGLYRFSIDGVICEKVSNGVMEFREMFKFMLIQKL